MWQGRPVFQEVFPPSRTYVSPMATTRPREIDSDISTPRYMDSFANIHLYPEHASRYRSIGMERPMYTHRDANRSHMDKMGGFMATQGPHMPQEPHPSLRDRPN